MDWVCASYPVIVFLSPQPLSGSQIAYKENTPLQAWYGMEQTINQVKKVGL